jgi:hypothetical protein
MREDSWKEYCERRGDPIFGKTGFDCNCLCNAVKGVEGKVS